MNKLIGLLMVVSAGCDSNSASSEAQARENAAAGDLSLFGLEILALRQAFEALTFAPAEGRLTKFGRRLRSRARRPLRSRA